MLTVEIVGKVFFLFLGELAAFFQGLLLLLYFCFALGVGSFVLFHTVETFLQRAFGSNHGVCLSELSRFDVCLHLQVEVVQLVVVSAYVEFCHLTDQFLAGLAVFPEVAHQRVVPGLCDGMGIPQGVQLVLFLAYLTLHDITDTLACRFEVCFALCFVFHYHYQWQVLGIVMCPLHRIGVGKDVAFQLGTLQSVAVSARGQGKEECAVVAALDRAEFFDGDKGVAQPLPCDDGLAIGGQLAAGLHISLLRLRCGGEGERCRHQDQ